MSSPCDENEARQAECSGSRLGDRGEHDIVPIATRVVNGEYAAGCDDGGAVGESGESAAHGIGGVVAHEGKCHAFRRDETVDEAQRETAAEAHLPVDDESVVVPRGGSAELNGERAACADVECESRGCADHRSSRVAGVSGTERAAIGEDCAEASAVEITAEQSRRDDGNRRANRCGKRSVYNQLSAIDGDISREAASGVERDAARSANRNRGGTPGNRTRNRDIGIGHNGVSVDSGKLRASEKLDRAAGEGCGQSRRAAKVERHARGLNDGRGSPQSAGMK